MKNCFKIKGVIIFLILLSVFATATEFSRYYILQLEFSNGELSLRNLNTELIDEPSILFGGYSAQLFSFEKRLILKRSFDVSREIIFDNVDESGKIVGGGTIVSNQKDFTLYLPYYPNAKEIILSDINGKEKLRIDVSMFAQEIPDDSLSKEIERADDFKEKPKLFSDKNLRNIATALIVILLVLIILIYTRAKRKGK